MLYNSYINKFRLLVVSFLCMLVLGLTACDSKSPKNNLSPAEQKFFELCANGTPEQIEEAIKRDKIDVNKITITSLIGDKGITPLMVATRHNRNPEVIKVLLKAGANVNAKTDRDITALIFAAGNNTKEVVLELINSGADVNVKNKDGHTPLNAALYNDDSYILEIVKTLISAGADVNIKDDDGNSAISLASIFKRSNVIEILIKAGANINEKNNRGNTPLISAVSNVEDVVNKQCFSLYNKLKESRLMKESRIETIKALLAAKAEVNAKNNKGLTALMVASEDNKNIEVINILISNGADINLKSDEKWNALSLAAKNDNLNAIKILIKAGANVNTKSFDESTALIIAAKYGKNPEVVKTLIDAGADINAKNIYGNTAKDYLK